MSGETPRVLQTAGGSDRPDWPSMESAIRQLAVNYALGTDAIGRDAPETGRALYQQTFTADADISIAGNPDTQRTGPDEWVGFVEGTFRGAGHVATQHLIGSVNIVPGEGGESAEMSTYMHASHLAVRWRDDKPPASVRGAADLHRRSSGGTHGRRLAHRQAHLFVISTLGFNPVLQPGRARGGPRRRLVGRSRRPAPSHVPNGDASG